MFPGFPKQAACQSRLLEKDSDWMSPARAQATAIRHSTLAIKAGRIRVVTDFVAAVESTLPTNER